MVKHTPTPWMLEKMNDEGIEIVGDDGSLVDIITFDKDIPEKEMERHKRDAFFKMKAVNAFHCKKGRSVPAEHFEVGLFWELRDALQNFRNGVSTGVITVDSDEDERLTDMWHKINTVLWKTAPVVE